jgi:hypothetical protein
MKNTHKTRKLEAARRSMTRDTTPDTKKNQATVRPVLSSIYTKQDIQLKSTIYLNQHRTYLT